jgi:hypothetical protein
MPSLLALDINCVLQRDALKDDLYGTIWRDLKVGYRVQIDYVLVP